MSESPSATIRRYVVALGGVRAAARFFDCSPGMVHYAINNDIGRSSKLSRVLVRRGALPPERVRWSPNCTIELRDAINNKKKELGFNNEQMLEWMWSNCEDN